MGGLEREAGESVGVDKEAMATATETVEEILRHQLRPPVAELAHFNQGGRVLAQRLQPGLPGLANPLARNGCEEVALKALAGKHRQERRHAAGRNGGAELLAGEDHSEDSEDGEDGKEREDGEDGATAGGGEKARAEQ